ncbi:hypothetical protein [Streptomyces albipurpureus]|uniref:Integral membrane protein n=1 Tax=Streptomyces albipurpureus TaxID=2897419 RepID=A0ABT0UNR5_9ACTN|nr:hypothetical protein [Streptomyces sp. CWNU-1]MCM2389634.1 hypothetical protein [Streptomyces sp. CWNU-1]
MTDSDRMNGVVPGSDSASSDTGGRMRGGSRTAFLAELERLRADAGPGPRDQLIGRLGIALIVGGLIWVFVCFNQTAAQSDLRDQMEMVVLAILGVGITVLGAIVYAAMSVQRFMRFWLLRVIYEQRDLAGRGAEPPVPSVTAATPAAAAPETPAPSYGA